MVQTASPHGTQCVRVGVCVSAARQSKRAGSVWNCLWGHALNKSPGINRKSGVLYLGPGVLSSATWPSLPKTHYNGLTNQLTVLLRAYGYCRIKLVMQGKSYLSIIVSCKRVCLLYSEYQESLPICPFNMCNALFYYLSIFESGCHNSNNNHYPNCVRSCFIKKVIVNVFDILSSSP